MTEQPDLLFVDIVIALSHRQVATLSLVSIHVVKTSFGHTWNRSTTPLQSSQASSLGPEGSGQYLLLPETVVPRLRISLWTAGHHPDGYGNGE